jgi:hypothetical protein
MQAQPGYRGQIKGAKMGLIQALERRAAEWAKEEAFTARVERRGERAGVRPWSRAVPRYGSRKDGPRPVLSGPSSSDQMIVPILAGFEIAFL